MIDYSKVMVVTLDEKSVLYSSEAIKLGADVNKYFKKRNTFVKVLNHFDKYAGTDFSKVAFGDWTNRLKNIELLILNTHFFSKPVIKYVNKKYPNIRIIVWYSNPVHSETSPSFFKDLNCELWTFDKKDAEVYGMHLNNQFIDKDKLNITSYDSKYKYDICFIGLDKNRLDYLLKLEKTFIDQGLKPMIYVVDSSKNSSSSYEYKEKLNYQELINYEGNSKAILDIVQHQQYGLSLRPIEAMFLKVKLITNNEAIKEHDFYNDENFFLLTERSVHELVDFIHSPYKELSEEILNNYTFKGWLDNFYK
ncbi:hypothetical protein D920_01302 [Enterococcus faecalis 13-SD-W-01]|nr:hypothetical protein D920_01302 [Enterococcus faecalis 13-SD-W-01]